MREDRPGREVAPPSAGGRPALLIIDMQHAFCDPHGYLGRRRADIRGCAAAVGPASRLLTAARRAGWRVIMTRLGFAPDYSDGGLLINAYFPQIRELGGLVRGSWDAEIVSALRPRPGEVVIDKTRYSAFIGTSLHTHLGECSDLLVAGVTTSLCVETTVRDAMQRDLPVTVVREATGDLRPEWHEQALLTMARGFARVRPADEVVAAMGPTR